MDSKHEITRADILAMADYVRERKERRRALVEVKKHRRLEVGPVCSFYFENFETMWNQIHEMLFIEKGGEAQIADELSAYNPLIPKGCELVATVMFEIDDPVRRGALLDEATLRWQKLLAEAEGIYAEPTSSAAFAGLEALVERGEIGANDRVVVPITGFGLKDKPPV